LKSLRSPWSLALVSFALVACGGQSEVAPTDSGAPIDATPDVAADAARVMCPDVNPNAADSSVLCAPGQICGNSGGVPGNFCCFPTASMPGYCPD
jgi:hypothetical protein